jgi:hypothetical protein
VEKKIEHLEIVKSPHSIGPSLSIDGTNEKHLIEHYILFDDFA